MLRLRTKTTEYSRKSNINLCINSPVIIITQSNNENAKQDRILKPVRLDIFDTIFVKFKAQNSSAQVEI